MSDENILMLACGGDLDGVKRYLASGGDVNHKNSHGMTAAIATSFAQDADPAKLVAVLEELVRSGADLEHAASVGRNPPKMRALHFACAGGRTELASAMVRGGADVNAVDGMGQTPLFRATQDRHERIIKMLLDNGADATIATAAGATPLLQLAEPIPEGEGTQDYSVDANLARVLIEAGVNVDAKDEELNTALLWTAHTGHHELASVLLKEGKAEVNLPCRDDGRTALFDAVVHLLSQSTPASLKPRIEKVIDALMEGGADAEIQNSTGKSPWDLARSTGRPDVMKRIDRDLLLAKEM